MKRNNVLFKASSVQHANCIISCTYNKKTEILLVSCFDDNFSGSRLLLIQEKDQLLRELRSISPKGRAEEEMEDIRGRCWQLECDLKQAVQVSNQQIAER